MGDEASSSNVSRRILRGHSTCQKRQGLLLEELQTNYDSIDILQWEDDDIALRLAAGKSRLPYDRPISQEVAAFPELSRDKSSTDFYLYLRNKMLQMWHQNPCVELTTQDIMNELPSPYDSDAVFTKRIYEFLQRFGYINVGIFSRVTAPLKTFRRRVVVIGAGIAGIAAARQLRYFGLDVVVLEARSRIGGRISTYLKPINGPLDVEHNRRACIVAELGASFIYGSFGNPLMTLTKQCDVVCNPVCLERCPLYDSTGKIFERRRTSLVERAFNNIIYAATYMAHSKGITEVSGHKLSLGDCFTVMLKQQQYRQQTKRLTYFSSYENVLNKLMAVQQTMAVKKNELMELREAYNELKAKEGRTDLNEEEQLENEIMLKCIIKDIEDAVKAYEIHDSKRKDIDAALAELANNEPSALYMNETDKAMLDFHIANLEYALGGTINDISLKYWNHNADFAIEGPNMLIAEGFTTFVDGLSDDLDIYLDHVVQKIEYDEQAVVVHCLANGCQNEIICGDYVLCTVPLGVLKETVQDRDNAPKFVPELPQWKVDAINALGFGNVNKILLIFEKAFWENTRVFGHISDAMCATNRGEMFMFQALSDKPVLIALVSGDSANAIEETPPNIIVFKIMSFLSAIFGSVCPKEPVDAIITYWRGDNFSRGAFSYVPPNCTPNAYDILAMPVKDISGCNRIFFAGEHTCRQHPASVHGAYLSGLREAGRLADQILGCPYGVQAVLEPE